MSLGAASSIAAGGLRFTAQGTRVVAENLANADMAGYGLRKTLATGSISLSASRAPQHSGVIRDVDPVLLGAVREADTLRQGVQVTLSGLSAIESAYGIPGDPGALNTLLSGFQASLHQAATTPDSTAALQAVAQDADRIANKFNTIGTEFQNLRQQADSAIAKDISTLNEKLENVASLNKDIQRQTLLGGDPFVLMDERARTISDIAAFLPIREIPREDNSILLVSGRGEILVDFEAAEFSFSATPGLGAADTRLSGNISVISLNGRALAVGDQTLASGKLGANLDLRDTLGPQAQADLDQLAMMLLTGFSGPEADDTLSFGETGLFGAHDGLAIPSDATGLAQQIRRTQRVDPSQPSTLWRLRSGLNAPAPGPSLEPANLNRMIDALSMPRAAASGLPERSLSENTAEQISRLSTARLGTETTLAFAQASFASKQDSLAARGVDTDSQMQDLLKLERAYAANAKVLMTIDAMLRQVLEI